MKGWLPLVGQTVPSERAGTGAMKRARAEGNVLPNRLAAELLISWDLVMLLLCHKI